MPFDLLKGIYQELNYYYQISFVIQNDFLSGVWWFITNNQNVWLVVLQMVLHTVCYMWRSQMVLHTECFMCGIQMMLHLHFDYSFGDYIVVMSMQSFFYDLRTATSNKHLPDLFVISELPINLETLLRYYLHSDIFSSFFNYTQTLAFHQLHRVNSLCVLSVFCFVKRHLLDFEDGVFL